MSGSVFLKLHYYEMLGWASQNLMRSRFLLLVHSPFNPVELFGIVVP